MSKNDYKSKITEDAAKRFRMLCEYTFNITEDDGEQEPDIPNEGTPENIANNEGNQANMEQNAEMPQDNNINQPSNDINDTGKQEVNPTGFNPSNMGDDTEMNNMMDDNISSETEPMQSDDEVIDVDELTQSQEETEEKVEKVKISMEKGFEKLLDVVNKLDKMIDNSTNNMLQIKHEIEKRNPTPLEKLNMRAANDSYPFNISPNEYWKEKEKNSNYRIGGEDEPDGKQYTITQGDLDKMTDFQRISKELNTSEYNQNLMNIFGLR